MIGRDLVLGLAETVALAEGCASPVTVQAMASAPGAPPEPRPVYRRWWFWTGIGALVVEAVVTSRVIAYSDDACAYNAGCATY